MTDKERLKQMAEQLMNATPKKQADLREQSPTVKDEEYYLAYAEDYYSIVGDEL